MSELTFTLDREKYFTVLRKDGLSTALTALHRDMEQLEFECFEGQAGYQPEFYERLKEYRDFSRELWRMNLNSLPG